MNCGKYSDVVFEKPAELETISMELLRRIVAAWDSSTATERLADVVNEAGQYLKMYDEDTP